VGSVIVFLQEKKILVPINKNRSMCLKISFL
jgi:hypothetical protein